MMKQLTQPQLKTAKQMNETGVTWAVVAAYYQVTRDQLRKQIKHYEETNK